MQLTKHANTSSDVLPLLAALSYTITLDTEEDMAEASDYDPTNQRTVYAMGRDYSTCRMDDSAGWFPSKNDTKKDD